MLLQFDRFRTDHPDRQGSIRCNTIRTQCRGMNREVQDWLVHRHQPMPDTKAAIPAIHHGIRQEPVGCKGKTIKS